MKRKKITLLVLYSWSILFGLWFCAMALWGRTMGYGATALSRWPFVIGLYIFFSAPFLSPWLFLKRPLAKRITTYLVLCLALGATAFLAAESIAGLEEYLFRKSCNGLSQSDKTVFKDRWWPFGNHYIGYNPETGQFFGGD